MVMVLIILSTTIPLCKYKMYYIFHFNLFRIIFLVMSQTDHPYKRNNSQVFSKSRLQRKKGDLSRIGKRKRVKVVQSTVKNNDAGLKNLTYLSNTDK